MANPLASAGDLAGYWRPLTDAEETIAYNLLAVASALVRKRVPDVDAQIAAGTLDPVIVTYVVCEMVKSAVESSGRPVDAKSQSQTMGPYTSAVTYAAASSIALVDGLADLLVTTPTTQLGSAR